MLQIDMANHEGILEVSLEGRLDSSSAAQFKTKLEPALSGVKGVRFDFSKLRYISSAGIRVLVFAKKSLGGKESVVIEHASKQIREIMDYIGASALFLMEEDA